MLQDGLWHSLSETLQGHRRCESVQSNLKVSLRVRLMMELCEELEVEKKQAQRRVQLMETVSGFRICREKA
ncbi:hypothetical protein TNCV_843661 [Trichonephila clavipes]|nr:hypothetical protein TNCV_843661 [Trichonephila clavipes]